MEMSESIRHFVLWLAYLVGAVIDVHDLVVGAPALARTLLEHTDRVLVTARPDGPKPVSVC
jgi:hypothetical protein